MGVCIEVEVEVEIETETEVWCIGVYRRTRDALVVYPVLYVNTATKSPY
jgi:hypothetical protein